MKGRLLKADGKWLVSYNDSQGIFKLLPLHPFDAQMISEQEKIFDNIEARISAYPDIEFGIEMFWETGIEEPFETALLITDDEDWDVTLNDGLESL
jgi:hypothetical protein